MDTTKSINLAATTNEGKQSPPPATTNKVEDSLKEVSVNIDVSDDDELHMHEEDEVEEEADDLDEGNEEENDQGEEEDEDEDQKEEAKVEKKEEKKDEVVTVKKSNKKKAGKVGKKKAAPVTRKRRYSDNTLDDEEIERRLQGPQPPLAAHGDFYFYCLIVSMIFNMSFLWWGWRALPDSSSFPILLTINFGTIVALVFYYKESVRAEITEFLNIWWHKTKPIKRKMKSVIKIACSDSKQLSVLYGVLLITFGTGLCAFPAIVLKGDWWTYVRQLPPELLGLFIMLLISTFASVVFTSVLNLSIQKALITSCKVLEYNDYAVLEEKEPIQVAPMMTTTNPSVVNKN
jgi:hypothetical protein